MQCSIYSVQHILPSFGKLRNRFASLNGEKWEQLFSRCTYLKLLTVFCPSTVWRYLSPGDHVTTLSGNYVFTETKIFISLHFTTIYDGLSLRFEMKSTCCNLKVAVFDSSLLTQLQDYFEWR